MADPVELAAVAEQQGLNAGDVLRWYSQSDVQSNPEYKAMPANKVVQKYMQGVQALTQVKETGKLDLNALLQPQQQRVEVTGQRPRLPTTVNPYAGTTQEAANPDFPNASSISQFDPAAVKAAQDEYSKRFNAGQPYRDVANMVAAAASGWGSGKAGEHVSGIQKMYQEQLADQTIGAQKRQMDAATAGQAALTSAQAREESAGKFMGTQREQQQKLDIGQFSVEQQKRLNNPTSIETSSLKAIIPSILAKPNLNPASKAELERIARDPGATAAMLAPILATLVPAEMNAWLDSIKGRVGEQEVRGKTAETDIGVKVRDELLGGNKIDPKVQADRDRERLKIVKAEYDAEKDPATKAGLFRELTAITKSLNQPAPTEEPTSEIRQRLDQSAIPAGKLTLAPLPRNVIGAQNDATQAAETEKRVRNYDTQLAPTITALRSKLEGTSSGRGTELFSRIFPGESRELVGLFNRFNALYPGVLQSELSPEMARSITNNQFPGSVVAALPVDAVKRMLALIESSAANDRNYQRGMNKATASGAPPGQYGTNQPVPNTSPTPANAGLPQVSSKEQFERLPKGTRFFNTVTKSEQVKL